MQLRLGSVRKIIREELRKSDSKRVALSLSDAAHKANSRVTSKVDDHSDQIIYVKFLSGDPDKTEEALVSMADELGWSLLSKSKRNGLVWGFEPKPETKGSVSRVPNDLWHITPTESVQDIMRMGLVPRAGRPGTGRHYSPRIYLATDAAVARSMINSLPGEKTNLTLLKVDVSKLPAGQKFYVDQLIGRRKDGSYPSLFTVEPIPADAISVI